MSGLRQRSVRYWLVGISLLAFAVMYVSPLVIALRTPAYEAPPAPLPNVAFPSIAFPSLKVPKVAPPVPLPKAAERAAAPAADPPAAAQGPASRTAPAPREQATVPVVTDQFSLTPPAPKGAPGEAAEKDPFESVPIVDDAIGTIPPPTMPTVTPTAVPAAQPEPVPTDGSGSGEGAVNPIPDEATTVAAGTSATAWAVSELEDELQALADALQAAVAGQSTPPPPSDVRSVTYTEPAATPPAPEQPAAPEEPAPPPAPDPEPEPEAEPVQTITGPEEEAEVASTTAEPEQQPVLAPEEVPEPETLVDAGLTEELAGDLQVAASLDFGTAAIGSPVTLTLELANLGTADLTVTELTLVGAPGPFSLPAGSPLTIAPGGSASISIAFAPTKAGSYPGRLLVATDDPDGSVEVELAGQATAWQLDGTTARGPPAADGWNHVLRIGSAGAELVDASGYVDAISLDGVTAIALTGSGADDTLTL
ncbi:MAG TPA: choice-of-anchor D domain-containing protein, partial [Gaiellaceae bacterium]|nr:choice-of-anchor D domain-containing protein [Gaiellaceae bacterium]